MVAAGTIGQMLSKSQETAKKLAFNQTYKLLKNTSGLSDGLREELLSICVGGLDKGTKGVNNLLKKYGIDEADLTLEWFIDGFNYEYNKLEGGGLKLSFSLNASDKVADEICQRWNRTVAKSQSGKLLQRVAEPNCCDWCAERNGIIMRAESYDGIMGHANWRCYVVPVGA